MPNYYDRAMTGLLGEPQTYGGLLGPQEVQQAQRDAQMAMAAQLLEAGGWSPQRTSLGQALGRGISAGRQARQASSDQALNAARLKNQIETQGGDPAQLRYFKAMTHGMSPEDVERAKRVDLGIEGRATSAGMSPQKVMGPDGREYFIVFDPRTGQARPVLMDELFGPQVASVPAQGAPSAATSGAPRMPFAGLTPAEKAAQEAKAKADVELSTKPQITEDTKRAEERVKKEANAGTAYKAVEYSLSETNKFIEQARRLRSHPGLKAATGFGGAQLSSIPGTPAADAAAELDNLKNIAFIGALSAMRAASPTGGAVGNVSNAEGARFENAYTALAQSQSYPQFVSNLDRLIEMLEGASAQMQEAYMRDYGDLNNAPKFGGSASSSKSAPKRVKVDAQGNVVK